MKGVTLHHKLKNGQSYAYHFEIMKKQFILLLALVVSFPILATANKKPSPTVRCSSTTPPATHACTSTIDRLVDYCMNTHADNFYTGESVKTIKQLIAKNKAL